MSSGYGGSRKYRNFTTKSFSPTYLLLELAEFLHAKYVLYVCRMSLYALFGVFVRAQSVACQTAQGIVDSPHGISSLMLGRFLR